jgi:DNA repair exonuclease SbcCD ATPase subunit
MKIVRLTAENIKRLTAVEISPEGNLITIGGKNGAGKSSVLDSIAYALGGQKLVPERPIRKGQDQASVEVELSDGITITRRFWLQSTMCNCGTEPHNELCDSLKKTTVKSDLVVKNKDGLKFTSPQATLDKLLGQLSFDPLYFVKAEPTVRHTILKRLVGLDTTEIDEKRLDAFQKRTSTNKQLKAVLAKLNYSPKHEDVPAEEISVDEVSKEMHKAEVLREKAISADQEVMKVQSLLDTNRQRELELEADIAELETELKKKETLLKHQEKQVKAYQIDLEQCKIKAATAKAEVPDAEEIGKRLKEIEEINAKVRDNKVYEETKSDYSSVNSEVEELTKIIETCDKEKKERIAAAKYPVEGLSIEDNAVMFNGIPFKQCSTAEQLKISVSIGLTLNPELKILLVRDGNSLDSDSLKLIAQMAEETDSQLWLERVAETKEGAMIMIEDGSVI